MSPCIHVGAVSYLNARPLIEGLADVGPEVELVLDLPSRLASHLAAGAVDVALIPAIEYFRAPSYRIIPGIAICSRGPVLSVTLFSRLPWLQIRSVALDEGSRTSAALVHILLRRRDGLDPRTRALPLNARVEDADADAVLLIGDRAMRACLPGFEYTYDLGQEWHEWTGLPFVYAFWAVRSGVDLGPVAAALTEAKERGLARLGEIAYEEASRLGLDAAFCRRYLAHIIHFDLGPRELAGLQRFYRLACEAGQAARGVNLEFYRLADPAESPGR